MKLSQSLFGEESISVPEMPDAVETTCGGCCQMNLCTPMSDLFPPFASVTVGVWYPATENWTVHGGTYGCLGREPTAIRTQAGPCFL